MTKIWNNAGIIPSSYLMSISLRPLALALASLLASITFLPLVTFAAQTAVLLPTSDVIGQWTPSVGTSHFANVDETPCNNATDFNSTTVVGGRDSYGVDVSSVPNGAVITQIDISPCAARFNTGGAGNPVMNVFYRYGSAATSTDMGNYSATSTTYSTFATSTYSISLTPKTATSTLAIGAVLTSAPNQKGVQLSRIATVLTFTPLTAPTNLVVTATSTTAVGLTWTDTAPTVESGFNVERSIDGINWTTIATTSTGVAAYYKSGLSATSSYQFRVRAFNFGANSGYSNIAANACSGGTVTAVDNTIIHTFTSVGSTTLNCSGISARSTRVLVVAGGGGGGSGSNGGGGGGAGGYLYDPSFSLANSSYSVAVGQGGSSSQNGGNSIFDSMTAVGGGTGSGNGGSGGGANWGGSAGLGTSGQGNNGGSSLCTNFGGGGGGPGAVGNDGVCHQGGFGGDGLTNDISGTTVAYAGGGGGAGTSGGSNSGGRGGLGGGGDGATGIGNSGSSASTNSGGGGGGGFTSGGNGGSGIVIVAYSLNAPSAPSNAVADASATQPQISLTWTDNSYEFNFEILRSTDGNTYTHLATTSLNVVNFTDTGLSALTTYYYKIRAFDGNQYSSLSNVASTTTNTTPSSPSGMGATASTTALSVALGWTDNSSNETNFVVERSVTSTTTGFSTWQTLGLDSTSTTDTTVSPNTTYYYRVYASNGYGSSAPSAAVTVTSASIPAAPSDLILSTTTSSATLNWTDNSSNELGFKIERDGTQIATVSATTTYTDANLLAGTYVYRLRAYNDVGNSDYSNSATTSVGSSGGAADCIGGTITHVGTSTIHTFDAVGTTTLDCSGAGPKTARVLVVAGGGGGGSGGGGGGGAGGYLYDPSFSLANSSYSVAVGQGGSSSQNGGNSIFDSMTAVGGGTGSGNGGSGGGANWGGSAGLGTSGQGNNGGSSLCTNFGGGGGGPGAVGNDGVCHQGGFGGDGLTNDISGTTVAYAGGGGGAGTSGGSNSGGRGGLGGGGDGATGIGNSGSSASTNSGGGGGGGFTSGGNGGSGIVIVSYPTP